MTLCEYDDQLVPMFISSSAASFKLNNMWLPRMQRSVGLPREYRMTVGRSDVGNSSPTMLNTAMQIALESISASNLKAKINTDDMK